MPVYQLFYAPDQMDRMFNHTPYVTFGLEPCVNPQITEQCPELESAANRVQLVEYGAMLHLWRNADQYLQTNWLGFTSYRQSDKVNFELFGRDVSTIESLLEQYDVLGWLFYEHPMPILEQAEICHPGITLFLQTLFDEFERHLPTRMRQDRRGLFGNYWIMTVANFRQFMEWSFPMIQWCLEHQQVSAHLRGDPKAIGYVMERLFIAWYMAFDKALVDLTQIVRGG